MYPSKAGTIRFVDQRETLNQIGFMSRKVEIVNLNFIHNIGEKRSENWVRMKESRLSYRIELNYTTIIGDRHSTDQQPIMRLTTSIIHIHINIMFFFLFN